MCFLFINKIIWIYVFMFIINNKLNFLWFYELYSIYFYIVFYIIKIFCYVYVLVLFIDLFVLFFNLFSKLILWRCFGVDIERVMMLLIVLWNFVS